MYSSFRIRNKGIPSLKHSRRLPKNSEAASRIVRSETSDHKRLSSGTTKYVRAGEYANWHDCNEKSPVNYVDLWGLECEVSDRIAALGKGKEKSLPVEAIKELEKRDWEYIGDNDKAQQEAKEDLMEKVFDKETSPNWSVSGRDSTTRYYETTPVPKSKTPLQDAFMEGRYGKRPTEGPTVEKKELTGYEYSARPRDPQTGKTGPTTTRYLDANNDGYIDFRRYQ